MKMCKHHELSISMLHWDDPGIDLQLIRSQRLHRKHLDLDLKHEDCCNFWSCFCLYWYVCINLEVSKFMIFPSIVHACITLRVILRNSLYFEILCMQHGYMHITSYRFGLVLFLFPYPKYCTINWNLCSLTFLVPVAYVLAVDCQTNEFCQDVHNSHMGCAHGSLACINNKCTCYIPNNHNIGKCTMLYQNDGSVLTMTIFDNLYMLMQHVRLKTSVCRRPSHN